MIISVVIIIIMIFHCYSYLEKEKKNVLVTSKTSLSTMIQTPPLFSSLCSATSLVVYVVDMVKKYVSARALLLFFSLDMYVYEGR